MQLLHSTDVPRRDPSELVVHEGWPSLAVNVVMYGLATLVGLAGVVGLPALRLTGHLPGGLGGFDVALGVIAGSLFVLVGSSGLGTCLRRSNWLMRVRDDGLLLKFRSDANARLPEPHPVVLALSYDAVVWARLTREWVTTISLGGDGSTTARAWFVDLKLDVDPATRDAIAQAFETEMRYTPPGSATLTRHYPVLLDDDVLRVAYHRGHRPSRSALFDRLKYYVAVERPLELDVDLSGLGASNTGAADAGASGTSGSTGAADASPVHAQIRELKRRGQLIAAVNVARRAKRISLAEARALVDGL